VYAIFLAMFIAAVPFFVGLYNACRLLNFIDKGMPFTTKSARSVKAISLAAGFISFAYMVSMPFFYIWADKNDAPGLLVIGMVLIGAPLVIAVFGSLLYKLMGEATEIKSENELTV
jgi:uncharacterized membrane protein YiaA